MTRVDFVRYVLQLLQATGAGQDVSAEDSADVTTSINIALAELAAKDAVDLTADFAADDFPDAFADCVGRYAANIAAPKFGLGRDEAVKRKAEVDIRDIAGRGVSFEPATATYY